MAKRQQSPALNTNISFTIDQASSFQAQEDASSPTQFIIKPASIHQPVVAGQSVNVQKLAGPPAKEHKKGRPVSTVEYAQ